MAQPSTVTVLPSLLKSLRTLVVGNLAMVGGIIGISISLIGLGTTTVVVCAVVVGLSSILYLIAALSQRPRVVITPEGFVFDKLFGREAHKWEEIDGQFAVIKLGWGKSVAYKLTPDYKARMGRKATSLFGGYDAVVTGALRGSPEDLAELLNEHKQRNQASTGLVSLPGNGAASGASADLP
jgi:hypothetical protein